MLGTCYRDAWRFQVHQGEGKLIHGSIIGADGVTVKHAWVELSTGYIYEPQTKQFFKKEIFEKTFNPVKNAQYSVEEALTLLGAKGYHGAWAEQEKEVTMPYPPESSWNLPPTAAQIFSINRGRRILKEEEITEATRPEKRWQARDMMQETWARVAAKKSPSMEKKDNPGNLRKMRIKLIELQTDMENAAPELEGIYRSSMEDAVEKAHYCDLYDALDSYAQGRDIGKLIERRLGTAGQERFMAIEDLAKQAIIEELIKNCSCELRSEKES